MKTATINFKTDEATKRKAQAVSKQIGIPLSSLLNAYVRQLASTGTVYFAADEPMTPKMEKVIERIEKEIASGELSGPFETDEELYDHLDSLK